MTDPFRDSEMSALARVEDLERENERLAQELEMARNLAGENHQAYVKHLEDQVRDLKNDVAQAKLQLALVPKRALARPDSEQQKFILIAVGAIILLSIIASLLTHR
jgi:hypothetical protein